MDPNPCSHCTWEIPLNYSHCPHCGYGMNCPNVVLARQQSERDALEARYNAAMVDAAARGCEANVRTFEVAVTKSEAVMGSTLQKLLPVVTRDRDVFATYHQLAELRFLREASPIGPDWNVSRPQAEIALLGNHQNIDSLHYAALSINGRSLPHYGDVTIKLRETYISHRASVFQENSALFAHRHGGTFPQGTRSVWADRHKLAVAKLAEKIGDWTLPAEFSTILLKAGATGLDDEFVEVHVFGWMTFATFAKVTVAQKGSGGSPSKRKRTRRGTTDERAVQDYCKTYKTQCEFV